MTPEEVKWLDGAKSRPKRARITAVEIRCSGERDGHLVVSVHPVPFVGPLRSLAVWRRPGSMSTTLASYTATEGKARTNAFLSTDDQVTFVVVEDLVGGSWLKSQTMTCRCRTGTVDPTNLSRAVYDWLAERKRTKNPSTRVLRLG